MVPVGPLPPGEFNPLTFCKGPRDHRGEGEGGGSVGCASAALPMYSGPFPLWGLKKKPDPHCARIPGSPYPRTPSAMGGGCVGVVRLHPPKLSSLFPLCILPLDIFTQFSGPPDSGSPPLPWAGGGVGGLIICPLTLLPICFKPKFRTTGSAIFLVLVSPH